MHDTGTASGYPEFDVDEAMDEGGYVQFFEQAFEWEQMTYLFYPYFWIDKPSWPDRVNLQSADVVFAAFLRAGYARVLVPVTPAYRHAVLYFLNSGGQIWNGSDPPTIDDPLYVSIVDELEGAPEERVPVDEPVGADGADDARLPERGQRASGVDDRQLLASRPPPQRLR